MRATIEVSGQPLEIEISPAITYLRGEFGGNVDLSVFFREPPENAWETIRRDLRIRIAGIEGTHGAIGHLDGQDRTELTFHLPDLAKQPEAPGQIEILWSADDPARTLGAVPCTRAEDDLSDVEEGPRPSGCAGLLLIAALLPFLL